MSGQRRRTRTVQANRQATNRQIMAQDGISHNSSVIFMNVLLQQTTTPGSTPKKQEEASPVVEKHCLVQLNPIPVFYRPLSVRVALTGLEIWSDQDKIQVDKSPSNTLNRFLEWRTRELLPRLRHDNAQLIMGESFDGTTVGMASQSSMCSKDRSGGVNVDHLVSVLGVASTIAHELGHNLGMNHDTADRRCQCQNEPRLGGCIMEPSTGFMPGQLFSSCSARDLSLSLLHGGGMCLFNVPQPEKLLGGPRCGNLYVEKGEECDCGLLDECNDPCCNATTCKLVPGAQCSSDGICCDNCKLRTGGWMCRQPLGECDLPEHCTGTSPYCPPNVFRQNGEPCEEASSYCYSGVCASFNTQCQMLWGPNSTRAPPVCFSSVNKQGNKYGNCGQMPNGTYIPCSNKDVHCGRLQCQGGNDRPLLGTSAEILTTKVKFNYSDFVCRGTYFHLGDDVSDPAMVAQGTACGLDKACWNQRCQDVSLFGVDDCQSKCNGHGVCNSNKNCHCDVGWAPPDCRYTGHGGSVDSGPARAPRGTSPFLCEVVLGEGERETVAPSDDTPRQGQTEGYLQPPTYHPETRLSIAHKDLRHGTTQGGCQPRQEDHVSDSTHFK
uniref:ADAM metallopeptidase domain 15 n=1 Tax=Salmo trutta TaxID=8032 RepID=A0A673Z3H7_SALTR